MITQKRSFFYNHLRIKLDDWSYKNPGKRPFVSIKIFEFDEMRMKVRLDYSSEPEIEVRKMKRIDEFQEVSSNKKRRFRNKPVKYDNGEVHDRMILETQDIQVEVKNKFSILAFEEDKDLDVSYKMESYDEVDTASCNLLEIINPIVMKPKRLLALPGEEYYFNTPINSIDDELLNEMTSCKVFRLCKTPKVDANSQTDVNNLTDSDTQTGLDETKVNESDLKYNAIQVKLRNLKRFVDSLMNRYSKNKSLRYKEWVKENGFIKSLEMILNYFDSTFDEEDDYDSDLNDEDIRS